MIGERLRELRKAKKMKQEELGSCFGLSKAILSSYELGKSDPPDKIKIELARYFNISLDYLIGVIDERVPYYNEKTFLKLPDNISDEEIKFITEYLEYTTSKRKCQLLID